MLFSKRIVDHKLLYKKNIVIGINMGTKICTGKHNYVILFFISCFKNFNVFLNPKELKVFLPDFEYIIYKANTQYFPCIYWSYNTK